MRFAFVHRYITLRYEEITAVGITRSGFVQFTASNQNYDFAFTGVGLGHLVEILQDKGVKIETGELSKLRAARMALRRRLS